jgi:hypothetical protein
LPRLELFRWDGLHMNARGCAIGTSIIRPVLLSRFWDTADDLAGEEWLRGLDSNQDNQLQRLACYQLHYPGVDPLRP